MPSKFGEFRFLGAKNGKTMKVTAQAQKKPAGGAWTKCTSSFTCGNVSPGNPPGLIIGAKDSGTWNAQDWQDPEEKRIVVKIEESGTPAYGIIIKPNPPAAAPIIGATLMISDSMVKAWTLKTASTTQAATHETGTPWGQGDYDFIN